MQITTKLLSDFRQGLVFLGLGWYIHSGGKPTGGVFDLPKDSREIDHKVFTVIEENVITRMSVEATFDNKRIPFPVYHVNPNYFNAVYLTQMALGAIAEFVPPVSKTVKAGRVIITPDGRKARFIGYVKGKVPVLFEGEGFITKRDDRITATITHKEVRPVEIVEDETIVVAGEYAFRGEEVLFVGKTDIEEAKQAFKADDRSKHKAFSNFTKRIDEFKKNVEETGYVIFRENFGGNKAIIGIPPKRLHFVSNRAYIATWQESERVQGTVVVNGQKAPVCIDGVLRDGEIPPGVIFALKAVVKTARKKPIKSAYIVHDISTDSSLRRKTIDFVCIMHDDAKATVYILSEELEHDMTPVCISSNVELEDTEAIVIEKDDVLIVATSKGTYAIKEGKVTQLKLLDKDDLRMLD
jgi:hypothetical protein